MLGARPPSNPTGDTIPTMDMPSATTSSDPTEAQPIPLWMEVWGWYGIAAVVGAYALSTFEVLAAGGMWHSLLNLTGSCGVGLVCLRKRAWQGFWLEAVWAGIAITALVRLVV